MPKIQCKCGNVIGLSEIPSSNQKLIISDKEFDNFSGLIDAEEIYMKMKIVVECDNCGRLYIYNDGFDKPPVIYAKEL